MASKINTHNEIILKSKYRDTKQSCNFRNKDNCPLNGNCKAESVIYKAEIQSENSAKKPTLDSQAIPSKKDIMDTKVPSRIVIYVSHRRLS